MPDKSFFVKGDKKYRDHFFYFRKEKACIINTNTSNLNYEMDKSDYQDILNKAVQAGQKRDYEQALRSLEFLVAETDSLPQAFLYLGRTYHALERYAQAVRAFRFYLSFVPNSHAGFFFLGRSYLSFGELKKAVYYLKKSINLNSSFSMAKGLLGFAYLKLKRSDLAVQYLEQAVLQDPKNTVLYTGYLNALLVSAIQKFRYGQYSDSRDILIFLLEKGFEEVIIYLHLGIIGKELGDYEEAKKYYEKALLMLPNDPLVKLQYVQILYALGDKSKAGKYLRNLGDFVPSTTEPEPESINRLLAVKNYQKGHYSKAIHFGCNVLKNDSSDIDMRLLIGEAYRILGEYNKAVNHFTRVIDRDRNNREARYGLAVTYWLREEYESMLRELERLEKIYPGDEISAYYKPLCYSKLMYPPDKSIPLLLDNLKKEPEDPYLLEILGLEYNRCGKASESEKYTLSALSKKKDLKEAYNVLFDLYRRLGNPKKLIKAYSDYLTQFPEEIEVLKNYIDILLENSIYNDAVAAITKIIPLVKKDRKYVRLLALCYRNIEDYDKAGTIYRILLKEKPEDIPCLKNLVFCLDKGGKREQALDLLNKAEKYLALDNELYTILGVLNYKSGNYQESLKLFRKSMDINSGDKRIYNNIGMVYKKLGMEEYANQFFSRAK